MSLLDSACRIGHRKYLLNELVIRLRKNTHDTFQTPISSPEGHVYPRIRRSTDHARIRIYFESWNTPCGSLDSWIVKDPWMFRFFFQGEDPRDFESSNPGIAESPDLWFQMIEIEDSLDSNIRGCHADRLILEYLDFCTQVVKSRIVSTTTSGYLHKNTIEESRFADPF